MSNTNLKAMILASAELLAIASSHGIDLSKAKQSVSRQFVRRQISLSATNKLVDPIIDKQAGVTSLNKGKLEGNQLFLITHIGLRFAKHDSETTVYGRRYTNNIYDILDVAADSTDQDAGASGAQSSPVAVQFVHQNLLDAQFKLIVDGNTRLELPAADFFVENTIQDKVRSHEDYMVSLGDSPIFLSPNKLVDAELEFNPSLTAPSNKNFVELVFNGVFIF